MPSSLHEALIEIFRQRPSLAELLTGALGMALPAHEQARVEAGDLTDLKPTEYRADAVMVLTTTQAGGVQAPVLGVVVEVQLRRDPDKRWSWPVYLATPDQAAAAPELAVLSAMSHGARPDRHDVLDALLTALAFVDPDRVLAALPTAAQRYLEALMTAGTYEYQSDFARRHRAQGGRAEGEAKAVLAVLEARGLTVPDAARTRVTECTDLDQLDIWVRRAATASSADDLFA